MRPLLVLLCLPAVLAAVEEVTNKAQFDKILADNVAVVADFYSTTCGPCIMMAPIFKEVAKEHEGKVKFIKVDVQRNYVGVQVRSMPTFHFYVGGKLEQQFSGADEGGLRRNSLMLAQKAEAMDIELSLGALEKFYEEQDPSKLSTVDDIYEKYPAYKLVQILKSAPRLSCALEVSPGHAHPAPPRRR